MPVFAQPPEVSPPRRPFGEDTHLFRLVLKMAGLKPIDSERKAIDEPADKILIVLGDTNLLDELCDLGVLKQFLERGGALLVATDRRTSDQLFAVLPARVSGEKIKVPREHSYRGELPDCPLVVEPSWLAQFGMKPHAIMTGLAGARPVVTNRPSCIDNLKPPLALVAELNAPGRGYTVVDRFPVHNRQMFAAVGEFNRGRAVVLADHSVFINSMMGQTDNGNITFALNIARWLSDDGRRTHVLLYDDGVAQSNFDVDLSLANPPFPPIEALVPIANQVIGEMEDENLFNQMLAETFGGGRILRGVLLFFTLGLLLTGAYWFLNSKFRTELRPAKAAPAAAPVPDLERRHQALLTRGNLAESAHELAYQAFASLGIEPAGPARRVTTFMSGSWWERGAARRRVRRLWRVATGKAGHVSRRRLERIAADLRDLHADVTGGKMLLVTTPDASRRHGGAVPAAGHR